MADGVNGPGPCSPRSSGSLLLRVGAGLVWSVNAADAKMLRPKGVGPHGVKVGRVDSRLASDTPPDSVLQRPAAGARVNASGGQHAQREC